MPDGRQSCRLGIEHRQVRRGLPVGNRADSRHGLQQRSADRRLDKEWLEPIPSLRGAETASDEEIASEIDDDAAPQTDG